MNRARGHWVASRFWVSRSVLGALCWVVVAGAAGCGSSSGPATAVPGGAAVRAGVSAPAYCKTLAGSKPLLHLSAAMSALARNPRDTAAQEVVRAAASAVEGAAAGAPAPQRAALLRAGHAIRALASHGLASARGLDVVLTHAGRSLQDSCLFPLG